MSGDHFITALQSQQGPSSFQFAFREHTHDFAFGDFFRSSANGSMRLAPANGDATNRAKNRMQNSFVIVFLVDDVADRPRASELQDQRIHPTDMIWHEKKAAGRQVLQTEENNAIKTADKGPKKKKARACESRWAPFFL